MILLRVLAIPIATLAFVTPTADAAKRCQGREIPEPYAVDEPIHRTLTRALGVLRRPAAPADAEGEDMKFAGDYHKVSPSTLRLVATVGGRRFWVMGVTVGLDRMAARCRRRLPGAARRREARWYRRQQARPLRLAWLYQRDDLASGAGFFGTAGDLYGGRMWEIDAGTANDDVGDDEYFPTVIVGLAPDGVASVEVLLVDDRGYEQLHTLPVTGNTWAAELGDPIGIEPKRITWRAADGATIKSFDF